MTKVIDFESIQRRHALDKWIADCRRRMALSYPKIDYDSDYWPIRKLYQTEQSDIFFTRAFKDFASKDVNYRESFRCIVAEMVIATKPKELKKPSQSFRSLADASSQSIFDLTLQDLRNIESSCIEKAINQHSLAETIYYQLSTLAKHVARLSAKGVIPHLGFYLRAETKKKLRKLAETNRTSTRSSKEDILDPQINAFNDAFNAMLENPVKDGKSILSELDRVAICILALLLCAPSRINEFL